MGMMINRRRVMGGKFLPYDAEIEYLAVEDVRGPYINTNYAWTSNNIRYDIVLMRTGAAKDRTGVFGSQKINQDTNWGIQFWSGDTTGYRVSHYIGKSQAVYSWAITQNEKISFTGEAFDDHTFSITIDGREVKNGTWAGTVCEDVCNVGLFTLWNGRDFTSRMTNQVRVYSFRLTDNGVVVRDFIPVRVGQVGYMYDKVSGQLFGNAGTGNFILGPDK